MGRTSTNSSSTGGRRRTSRYDDDYDGGGRGGDKPAVEVLIAHDPMLALDSDDDIDFGEIPGSSSMSHTSSTSSKDKGGGSTGSGGGGSKKKKRESRKKKKEEVEEVDDEEVFYVEKIKDKRWNLGRWEYLLAWQGYGPEFDTWEPTSNMDCDDLLQEFEAEWQKKPKFRFDRGEVARELIGMVRLNDTSAFMVLYKGSDDVEFVPLKECYKNCPNLVIEFYENRQIGLPAECFDDDDSGGGGGGEGQGDASTSTPAAAAGGGSSSSAGSEPATVTLN